MEISFIHVQPLVHLHANKTNFRMKGCTRTRFETDAKVNSEMDYSHLHTHARTHKNSQYPPPPTQHGIIKRSEFHERRNDNLVTLHYSCKRIYSRVLCDGLKVVSLYRKCLRLFLVFLVRLFCRCYLKVLLIPACCAWPYLTRMNCSIAPESSNFYQKPSQRLVIYFTRRG